MVLENVGRGGWNCVEAEAWAVALTCCSAAGELWVLLLLRQLNLLCPVCIHTLSESNGCPITVPATPAIYPAATELSTDRLDSDVVVVVRGVEVVLFAWPDILELELLL